MSAWRTPIFCYVSPAGNNKIAEWYHAFSAHEKAFVDEFLKNMRKLHEWEMPHYRANLSGGGGLGELRWKFTNKQHRLLGFFMRGGWYAVVGCTHKQQIYSPADALETAGKYKKQIEKGVVSTIEYDL